MNSISLIKRLFLVLTVVFLASCDDEFSELGADVVDGDIHNNIIKVNGVVTAYDKATGAVQANNLDVNTLGVYDNPVFGVTKANFVTQVEMASANINPTLYAPVLDTVWMYVPYRSVVTSPASGTTDAAYRLDSIYSGAAASFTLDVKKNGFYLRESDPNSGGTQGQKYYSDYSSTITAAEGISLLKDGPVADFKYSPNAIKRKASYTDDSGRAHNDTVVQTLAPGMFFYLKRDVLQNDLFGAGAAGKLLNNDVFKEYFRGLYFKAERNGQQSAYGAPNFKSGTITVKYTDRTSATDTTRIKKTMTLNLTGNTINLFDNTYNSEYLNALTVTNTTAGQGDERLYIKGGSGSMAFLDIDLASLSGLMHNDATGNRVLVNEASLIFYVDENPSNGMGKTGTDGKKAFAPPRVFLYDVNNKRPVFDYYTDATTISAYPKFSKYVHGGILDSVSSGGARYKIRITDHINNLINKDSTNVKLGLVVTEAISIITSGTLKSPWTEPWMSGVPPVVNVTTFPVASTIHPFGTVLYGTNPSVPEDKRLKLEIYYTKPD